MGFYYGIVPAVDFTTSATTGTEIDALFIRPGTGRAVYLSGVTAQGKGSQLTSLSGIINRVKTWTTTASSGGTAITPTPRHESAPAAKATAGQASGGVTSGTGGPSLHKIIGCGATGPGQWVARENDAPVVLEAGDNRSIDIFNSSNTASLKVEVDAEIYE